ncbi:MAG: Ldh family oxidoreductase [Caldilineaceae bacterium]|nr:Ldh family oxidoreductase [Caldilineaceae bacterium]
MPLLQPSTLIDLATRIFAAAGAPDDIAKLVATSLVGSDLVGHDSHGSVRVRQYLDAIRRGDLNPAARPQIVHEQGAAVTVDAQRGFGQVAAHFTINEGIRRAKTHGIAAAGLIHSGHVGRLGEWVELAAEHQTLALAFCNGGGPTGAVAPFGGAERLLGTNPLAAALPVGDESPIILDFATSAVAEGKVRVARNRGKSIPEGWILNNAGLPSTNPADLYDGGMLLPAATHKGYALSVLVEFMAGLLTGGGTPVLPGYTPGNGVLFIVLDIAAFRPPAAYDKESQAVAQRVKATKPAPGFDRVLLPGEPERSMAATRSAEGIQIDDATWKLLTEDAAALNVPVSV